MELQITFTIDDRLVFLHEICLSLGSQWIDEWNNYQNSESYDKQRALGRYIVPAILDDKPEYCITIPISDWDLIKMEIYKYINITSITKPKEY